MVDQDITSKVARQGYGGVGSREVKEFHNRSDVDSGYSSQHHTIGAKPYQAAPGDHEHRYQGIWLFKDTTGTHNSTGNYIQTSYQQARFWDKELYSKVSAQEIKVLKTHIATVNYRTTFVANANGRRGIRLTINAGVRQTFELPPIAGVPFRMWDIMISLQLGANDVVAVESFQNSGGNLDINSGDDVTYLKIEKTAPERFNVAGLVAGGIVPQIPGPVIASRQLHFNVAW